MRFYILFSIRRSCTATLVMSWLMGPILTDSPVNTVVTVPGPGDGYQRSASSNIAFMTMLAVLLLTGHSF